MVLKMLLMGSMSFVGVRAADAALDESRSVAQLAGMVEAMRAEMAQLKQGVENRDETIAKRDETIAKRDATIATLTDALKAKMEHRQVQLTAGGEVMQLVSEADFKELAARVEKLGAAIETLAKEGTGEPILDHLDTLI